MERTDSRQAAIEHAYARRRRKRLVVLVLVFAAVATLAITEERSGPVLGPIALAAVLVGWVIFDSRNWRCPACGEQLGRALNPKQCRRCGVALRG